MSQHGTNPATARTSRSAMRHSSAVLVLALITAGCIFGADNPVIEGSDLGGRDVQVPAGDNPFSPGHDPFNPAEDTTLVITACDLLETYLHFGQHILATKFTSGGEGIVPGRNDCTLKKPLVGDKDEYRINLFIWSPQEGSILDAEWEAGGHIAAGPPGPGWANEYRAVFDEGSSQNPTTIELPDGITHVGAGANFHFQLPEELGGIWISLHKEGTLAADYDPDELRKRFESLARFILARITALHNVEQSPP